MSRFENIRDRLPSLYRPDDALAEEPLLPLAASNILAINDAPPAPSSISSAGGTVTVRLNAPISVRQVRLSRGLVYGSGYSLEFYRIVDNRPASLPSAVGSVRNNVATLALEFRDARFAIRLRRGGLLSLLLRSVADALDELNNETNDVMQAHWYAYADKALYSPYFLRTLQLLEQPFPAHNDLVVQNFPYIHDLGRLGVLLPLLPWQTPPEFRERVEDYRTRMRRFVDLYRHGLGTIDALRRITEGQLPANADALEPQRDRPFWIEEFAPYSTRLIAINTGEPSGMVGPLMRWTISNDWHEETPPPTIYIEGVAPEATFVDETVNPLIELYQSDRTMHRLGICFNGTLRPEQTLRLRPAYASWTGLADGIARSPSLPAESNPADPTAPGPWQVVEEAKAQSVAAVHQSHDGALWVASNQPAGGTLLRFDGTDWIRALEALPEITCLAEDGHDLFIGTRTGLQVMPLYPAGDASSALKFAAAPLKALRDRIVHTIYRSDAGRLLVGTDAGLFRLTRGEGRMDVEPFVLSAKQETGIDVYGISRDAMNTFYFGTSLGLFQYQPDLEHWYWFAREEIKEQSRDWQRFFPEKGAGQNNFPQAAKVFLPPVRCVRRSADSSLWLGTEHGIARYVAHSVGELTYTTLLEAFPYLTTGRVFAIEEDARGLLWFCTARGLLRYDGRDWWQHRAGRWARLGRADKLAPEANGRRSKGLPVGWRFDRTASRWQRFKSPSSWENFDAPPLTTDEPPVLSVGWTNEVSAEVGKWDGSEFSDGQPVPVDALQMRFKPDETRIVNGGIPSVPRLPAGRSVWRYLSREPAALKLPPERPMWTTEGRLLPPPVFQNAPPPGRYDVETPPPASNFDGAVFPYHPSARVWFEIEGTGALGVLVRLKLQTAEEHIDPAIIDRVWQGIQQVRPAGVRAMLAVEEEIVRGKGNG